MRKRGTRPAPAHELLRFDIRHLDALATAVARVSPRISSLTVHMCWHDGRGHDYPPEAMNAAKRIRERHPAGGSDDTYTSLTFTPSVDDFADFLMVAPYCDLAYAVDASGNTLLEVSGEGSSASVRDDE